LECDRSPEDETHGWAEKALKVQQLINIYGYAVT